MSYDNTEDIGDYCVAAQKAIRAIETIPYPVTKDVLENVNLWGVQKCLDEIRAQLKLLQQTLVEVDKANRK